MAVFEGFEGKTTIRMVGDSVFFSVVFSVVNFYKHTHFFSFYKFVNEEFHTFAHSYDLTNSNLMSYHILLPI